MVDSLVLGLGDGVQARDRLPDPKRLQRDGNTTAFQGKMQAGFSAGMATFILRKRWYGSNSFKILPRINTNFHE